MILSFSSFCVSCIYFNIKSAKKKQFSPREDEKFAFRFALFLYKTPKANFQRKNKRQESRQRVAAAPERPGSSGFGFLSSLYYGDPAALSAGQDSFSGQRASAAGIYDCCHLITFACHKRLAFKKIDPVHLYYKMFFSFFQVLFQFNLRKYPFSRFNGTG